jgi:hypothetical protein
VVRVLADPPSGVGVKTRRFFCACFTTGGRRCTDTNAQPRLKWNVKARASSAEEPLREEEKEEEEEKESARAQCEELIVQATESDLRPLPLLLWRRCFGRLRRLSSRSLFIQEDKACESFAQLSQPGLSHDLHLHARSPCKTPGRFMGLINIVSKTCTNYAGDSKCLGPGISRSN